MTKRNNSKSEFGLEFQTDVALYMFLKEYKTIEKLKVEGKYQDIEFTEITGEVTHIQAKSVYVMDENANTSKLREAIKSFSDYLMADRLIYATNQKNPIMIDPSSFTGDDAVTIKFNQLTETEKNKIIRYIDEKSAKLKLQIARIPYFVDRNIYVRRKAIFKEIDSFINEVDLKEISYKHLAARWHDYLKNSAISVKTDFFISQQDFLWIVIVVLMEMELYKQEHLYQTIEDDAFIQGVIENYEKTNSILALYDEKKNIHLDGFIRENKDILIDIIYSTPLIVIDEEKENEIKKIVNSIINIEKGINKIKKVMNK